MDSIEKQYLKELNRRSDIKIDPQKSIKLYLQSATLLFKQANIYYSENDYENAYILYMKYCNLLFKLLPKHPDFHTNLIPIFKNDAIASFQKLELLKVKLKELVLNSLNDEVRDKEMVPPPKYIKPSEHKSEIECPEYDYDVKVGQNPPSYSASIGDKNFKNSKSDSVLSVSSNNNDNLNVPEISPFDLVSTGTMRPIYIPFAAIEQFLELAKPNTDNNLETCALLCGHLKNDKLNITHLVVPPQTATSDSCTTTDEMVLFQYQEENDLMTFGWIHTHPSQTCFMSSVDVHTQCSYQLLMPEAIAIVCAPTKDPSLGIFRLTDPLGIEIVSTCRQPELFHPHPQPDEIYETADLNYYNGHAIIADLRYTSE